MHSMELGFPTVPPIKVLLSLRPALAKLASQLIVAIYIYIAAIYIYIYQFREWMLYIATIYSCYITRTIDYSNWV